MSSEILLSSDEEKPKLQSNKISTGKDTIFLTSDSSGEDEHSIKKSKRKKKQKCYGMIDLLTSESDMEENSTVTRKGRSRKKETDPEVKYEELLTSDEDDVKTKKKPTKRKLEDAEYKPEEPPKKAQKKAQPKKEVTKKPRKTALTKTKNSKDRLASKDAAHSTENVPTEEMMENTPENTQSLNISDCRGSWQEYELVAEQMSLDTNVAKNIVKLFKDGNTIPFIARYRRNMTGDMTPEQLRNVKEGYDEICNLKSRIVTVSKAIAKIGKMNETLQMSINSTRSLEELEHIYEPFKQGGARTLADKARELGLEEPALDILNNSSFVNLPDYVNLRIDGLKTLQDVEKGITDVMYSVISTDAEMLAFVRTLRNKANFTIETKKSTTSDEKRKEAVVKKGQKLVDQSKFVNYFNFKCSHRQIQSHQILAINRGESQKILTVKIDIPEYINREFNYFCYRKWLNKSDNHHRKELIEKAIQETYKKRVQPLLIKEIRSELNQKAEKASYDVFITNLKHLLMASPLKGQAILGIDPGFSNGCKLALISQTGNVLDHKFIYPHKSGVKDRGQLVIKQMLLKYKCSLIVIGNGTACRETETWISDLIQNRFFHPMDVQYSIVCEDGASIYSCSPEAKKEFPDLDPNIISAVSLARRVQDPMAELVKIEPQHLGIGMYQLDMKKKKLDEALHDVVSECVSFVGVDLNTASQCLLRMVAGLTDNRATQIIEYRTSNGPFINRRELLNVFGIGERSFEQCAGFLRVGPISADIADQFYKNPKTTKLDCTIIHPESYPITKKILTKLNLKVNDIGEESFIRVFNERKRDLDISKLSEELKSNKETVQLVLDALSKPLNYDLRVECSKEPLFKRELTKMEDLKAGDILTGRVNNVTQFGCFVDVGVGCNGLIHVSKMNRHTLQIGDRVEVKVISNVLATKRLSLEALRKL